MLTSTQPITFQTGFIDGGELGDMSSGVVWLFVAGLFVLILLVKYQVRGLPVDAFPSSLCRGM